MAKIFITGSSDGLGFLAGKILTEEGHQVVFHARNKDRALEVKRKFSQLDKIVIGDVTSLAGMKSIAEQVNALGSFDSVIHNVGLGINQQRVETADGVTQLFAVNVLAPYVLTALINKPKRLIYMSSGMHRGGNESLQDPQWKNRSWQSSQAYSDTKLHDLILALGLARRWKDVLVNAVDPGWVPTKMGGAGAPDSLIDGAKTQAWLAVSDEPAARVSGFYFHHQKTDSIHAAAGKADVQDRLFEYLEKVTQIKLPH